MFKRLLPVLLTLSALPAWGTTQFYVGSAGEAQFGLDLTTRGLTAGALLDFLGSTVSGGAVTNVAGSGLNFSGPNILVDGSTLSITPGVGSGMQVALPANVYALGMYLISTSITRNWTYGPTGGTISIANDSTIFLGVMSTTPLTSFPTITLTAQQNSSGVSVVNFRIGTEGAPPSSSETPEPSTFALIGSGLILFPLIARRKRRQPRIPNAAR
jgi:hypothetical protein